MAATRKVAAMAVVAVIAVVAMLAVAATADNCGVDIGKVKDACQSYCDGNGGRLGECCGAVKAGRFRCMCDNYWGILQHSKFADCAKRVQSQCRLGSC